MRDELSYHDKVAVLPPSVLADTSDPGSRLRRRILTLSPLFVYDPRIHLLRPSVQLLLIETVQCDAVLGGPERPRMLVGAPPDFETRQSAGRWRKTKE